MSNLRTHPTAVTTVTDLSHLARPAHLRPADHTDQLTAHLRAGDPVTVHLIGHLVEAYRANGVLTVVIDTPEAGRLTVEATTDNTITLA